MLQETEKYVCPSEIQFSGTTASRSTVSVLLMRLLESSYVYATIFASVAVPFTGALQNSTFVS